MSYSRKDEYCSELCDEINSLIGVNETVEVREIRGELKECVCVSSKFNAYDKGDDVVFSFDDKCDYYRVMCVFRNRKGMICFDDNYLEFRFSLV